MQIDSLFVFDEDGGGYIVEDGSQELISLLNLIHKGLGTGGPIHQIPGERDGDDSDDPKEKQKSLA